MDTEGLSVICAGLGSFEEDETSNGAEYIKDKYCLDNLKDLLRFLRRDDPETRDVFKQVCKWNIVGKNLIPMIEFFQDDRNLVLNVVKVLVFLTMPIEATSKDVNQQLEYLWEIKSAITSSDVVAVIVSLLEKPLENLECMAFSDEDWKLVQLVLTLFRNILAVQDISVHQKDLGSANQLLSLRDDFLERLFKENVMDLIVIITQHVGGSSTYLKRDNMLLLEIYHYIFMCQDPELIAQCTDDSKVDKVSKAGLDGLESIMQEEAAKKRQARLNSSRHAQFGATFTRLTLDGSKSLCKGATSASCDKLLKPEKMHRGPSKRVVKDYARVPTTKRSLLVMLRELLNQFLSGGYNVLMQSVIEDIEKEHDTIQTSDVLMFFHLAQFATSFQYHKAAMTKHNVDANPESSPGDTDGDDDDDSTWFKGDICGPIASTMNESMFGLVIAKWHLAFEGLKETKNNSFLSVSGSLMKIMIRMLDLVLKLMPESSKEPQTARIILYKLFYDQTDQGLTQFLLNMVRSFDAHKQPRSDLADLVETIHVVIRLMEKLQAHGTLRVAKKARKMKRKKTDLKNKESETVRDDITIQEGIKCSDNEEHPDGSIPEKETSLQTACDGNDTNVDAPVPTDETERSITEDQNTGSGLPLNDEGEENQAHENIYDCNSSADEPEPAAATTEFDFKMTSWLINLASSSIVRNLCWLLKFYKSNSTATNHYVVSLLKRICDDLNLAPMLYQLSCLVIIYEILDDQKARPQKEFENLVHFLTSLVRRMLRKLKNQPLLFVDLLFWKSRKDCHYINVESIHRDIGEMRKEVRNWDHEDAGPSQASEGVRKSLADALGDDEYDVVISGEPRHEIHININGAEALQTGDNGKNIIKDSHGEDNFEGARKRKRRLVLSSKLEEQIRSLYEKYKESPNCIQLIAADLDANGNISEAQVSRKCKKLGLELSSGKNTIDPDGPSILKKSIRKRVRAIDEDLELKIKSLFEQFKEHKRCSHMIAEQLDPTGTVTAAQVSRKLKKLGLHTMRMRNDAKKQRMNDTDDASTDGEDDSDNNLTLSSLRKRNNSDRKVGKSNMMQSPVDSSDDELVLSSFAKNKKNEDVSISNKEVGKSITVQSPVDISDDELVLSSFAKKSRRGHSKPEDRQETDGHDSELVSQGFDEGDYREDSQAMDSDAEMPHSAHRASDQDSRGKSDNSPNEFADSVQNKHQYNELEDSEDEIQASASPKGSVIRRKLRVMLDFDED